MAWMPAISERTGISYAIIYLLGGVVLYLFFSKYLPDPDPANNKEITVHLTEMVVIISIMGTGIKIDRRFSWKNWAVPLRLISIAMLLCISVSGLVGYTLLNLDLASALLLGAVLAPTDPVLASDVQVGPPNEGKKSETKFSLTAEAGMNDGMAFPFTWLAITLALIANGEPVNFVNWVGYYFFYKIIAGIAIGALCGKAAGFLLFRVSKKFRILQTNDGFVALALTLLVYGGTELLHAYGFIAVFVCAITLRHSEKGHEYHEELHSFIDQTERLLVAVLLVLFGGSLVNGVLDALTWKMVLFSFLFLFIIRPLAVYASYFPSTFHYKEKLAISFFGIRGMGSVFYLAFAFGEIGFKYEEELWSVVAFTILISVFIHGITATPIMKHLSDVLPDEKVPE